MNTVDGHLYSAQAALCCLGYLAAFYDERADAPPEGFYFGLSVILGHIENEVRQAHNKLTDEMDEKIEPQTTDSAENSGALSEAKSQGEP